MEPIKQDNIVSTPVVTPIEPSPINTVASSDPVIINPTPVVQTSNSSLPQDNPTSFNKKPIFIIAAVILLLLLVAGAIFGFTKIKNKSTGDNDTSSSQKAAGADLSKYDIDTDKDVYPDFIETELGFDPKVSAYDQCSQGSCDESSINNTKTAHNILIILDASGSMQTGGRMDIAKSAIKNYISQASAKSNIGLMVYGHKGSNSVSDKPVSCASAEVLSPLGQVTTTSIDNLLASVQPVGWTPMGFALQQSAAMFADEVGQNNEIILLTDGEETCNSDPNGQALALKTSNSKVTINVIGFAVDANAQAQLNQISTNGGGTFSTANNLSELDQKFEDLYKNGLSLYEESKCSLGNVDKFRTCYNAQFNKIIEWVSKRKLMLYDKEITQEEYSKLDALSSKMYEEQKTVTSNETNSVINKLQQKREELNK